MVSERERRLQRYERREETFDSSEATLKHFPVHMPCASEERKLESPKRSRMATVKTLILVVTLVTCALKSSISASVNGHQVNTVKPKLIVLMIDAFRFDYFDQPGTIGFAKFAKSGSRSKWVTPIFPSITYPNMFSQVTGHYAEGHGVVNNNIFDPDQEQLFYASGHVDNTTYKVDDNGMNSFWWNQSEPIWIASERQGLRTGVFYWEGCQVAISNTRVTFCEPYKSLVNLPWNDYEDLYSDVIRRTVFNLATDSWDVAMIYYEMIDAMGHAYGISSPQFRTAFSVTDNLILKLLTLLELNNLHETTNVIIISDHGMRFKKNDLYNPMVDLSEYLRSSDDYDPRLGSGTIVQLWPKSEAIKEQAYRNLTRQRIKGARVYLRQDLPDEFHLKNNKRTAPITVYAEPGYNIRFFSSSWLEMGMHGFDPAESPEMRATFAATGPVFKKNFISSNSMLMVDHYNVFCHVLQINCQPNNGSLDRARDMFA